MRKYIYFCLGMLILFHVQFAKAQSWKQVGYDILGEQKYESFGKSVAISKSGQLVVIGAPAHKGNGSYQGQVKVYKEMGGDWVQVGNSINGSDDNCNAGTSVAINADGSLIAVGSPYCVQGKVQVYQYISNAWQPYGNEIISSDQIANFGFKMSFNRKGNILAISNNMGSNGYFGKVSIYKIENNRWGKIGEDIEGLDAGGMMGYSISLNDSGDMIAVGAPKNQGNLKETGQVGIYKNINDNWVPMGEYINGEQDNISFGGAVALSGDGNIMAVGASGYRINGKNYGLVKIYKNNNGLWTPTGNDIIGAEENNRYGFSISMSDDGNTIAIGSPFNEGMSVKRGLVRVYKNMNGSWVRLGESIYGNETEWMGYAISLSGDGNRLAVSAPNYTSNLTSTGRVQLYESTQANGMIAIEKYLSLYPNPTNGEVNINFGQTYKEVSIKVRNILGQEIYTKQIESSDRAQLYIPGEAGIYIVEILTNTGEVANMKVVKN